MESAQQALPVIYVTVVEYFGRLTIKPACETARRFAELLGQKTLTEADVEGIKRLGYEVRVEGRKL